MKNHILYSFRRCPYAMRARWAIKTCGLQVELREIDLKDKPDELVRNSIKKTVPLLILNSGQIIQESIDIIFWALNNSNMSNYIIKFYKNNLEKEIIEIIKKNDHEFKYHLDRFKYSSRFNENAKEFHYLESQKFIKLLGNILRNKESSNYWLIGNKESIADWSIWPFVRQYKIACESQKILNYFEPSIKTWLDYFENHNTFSAVMHKYKVWDEKSDINIFPKI